MDFKTLQKVRYFLAAAFPVLARLSPVTARLAAWLDRHPRLKAKIERVRGSPLSGPMRRANEMLVTGDYADDRLDERLVPAEAIGTLRAAVVLALGLVVLAPIAAVTVWPELSLEQVAGIAGPPVAGWSVALWMLGAALAWSTLLAGTGLANRFALPPALALFVYFNLVLSASLPRSWWSLALFGVAAVAQVGGEARVAARRPGRPLAGLIASVLNGMMTGFLGLATTPAGAHFKGRVLIVGMAGGAVAGVLGWWLSGRLARRIAAAGTEVPRWARADTLVGAMAGLHLVFTGSLAARGGLLAPAQGLQPIAAQIPGHLWPLYYLIGVGVIFKILRQTRVLHGTVRELAPPRVLVPFGLLLLAAATAVGWTDAVVLQPGRAWLPGMRPAAEWIAEVTPWLWRRPLWGLTMEWARWVFLVAFVLAAWSALRWRLTADVMARLLFASALLWFAIAEYFLEFSAFGKTDPPSPAGTLAFALFLLWLGHMTLRKFVMNETDAWPRPARVVLYGTGLLFMLLPVHARAALHDPRVAHEILLYLFLGLLDLGIPFYLHLYASRHFQSVPFPPARLLACFGVGAALAVAFTLLDKVAMSGGSFGAVWADTRAQVDAMLQHGRLPATHPPFLPLAWIAGRALLIWGAIIAAGVVLQRRLAGRELAPAATMFAVVAIASGVACFSNRAFEIPMLPPVVVQLLTPFHASRSIDVALVARYLSFLLPALVIGLALIAGKGSRGRAALCAAAVGLHLAILALWPAGEPWLRSTGTLGTAGALGLLVLGGLVVTARDRLAAVLRERENSASAHRLLTPRELRWGGALALAGLSVLGAWQVNDTRLVVRRLSAAGGEIALPAFWREVPVAGGGGGWEGPRHGLVAPALSVAKRPAAPGGPRTVLQAMMSERAPVLPGFAIAGFEDWDRFHPGTAALEYQHERTDGGDTVLQMGAVVVAPADPGTWWVFTLSYELGDRERRWDVVRALRAGMR